MTQYTKYCTEEQTKRAFKLGAPLDYCERHIGIKKPKNTMDIGLYSDDMQSSKFMCIPTTQQMIGWLRDKGLYMSIHPVTDGSNYNWYFEMLFDFINDKENWHNGDMYIFNSFKEAELAAIDVALDYLEEKGE